MSRSEGGVALVRGIVALIRSLGLDAIAEGVETAEQQRALERMGCVYAQGFHLARPMPAQAVGELLATR